MIFCSSCSDIAQVTPTSPLTIRLDIRLHSSCCGQVIVWLIQVLCHHSANPVWRVMQKGLFVIFQPPLRFECHQDGVMARCLEVYLYWPLWQVQLVVLSLLMLKRLVLTVNMSGKSVECQPLWWFVEKVNFLYWLCWNELTGVGQFYRVLLGIMYWWSLNILGFIFIVFNVCVCMFLKIYVSVKLHMCCACDYFFVFGCVWFFSTFS